MHTTCRTTERRLTASKALLAALAALALATLAPAGAGAGQVVFDPEAGAIRCLEFPAEAPCRLAQVLEADRAGNWGKVTYDRASDTYTVRTDLVVGTGDGTQSVLQVGGPDAKRERLVMYGDLIVAEPKKRGWQIYQAHNGLRIGLYEDDTVTPTVLFACEEPGERELVVHGGNIFWVCHAKVSALTEKPENRFALTVDGRIVWGDLRLIRSTISWFTEARINTDADAYVRRMIFEHGGELRGDQYLVDSAVRHMDCGLRDHGGLQAVLVRCRFENNTMNYELLYGPWGILAVDCFFGAAQDPPALRAYTWPRGRHEGQTTRPAFVSRRHLVVRVRDASGAPVAGAQVAVACEQDAPGAVGRGIAVTGADGATPGLRETDALYVTDEVTRPEAGTGEVTTHAYTYAVTVAADGYAPVTVEHVDPDQTWQVKDVVLARE